MNRFSLKISVAISAFLIGCLAVWSYFLQESKNIGKYFDDLEIPQVTETKDFIPTNYPLFEEVSEPINPLESIWIKQDKFDFKGYTIKRHCTDKEKFENTCKLKISKGKKVLAVFSSSNRHWLRYGFFRFLRGENKQLVIHTYSGGAHCCYDYFIYNLEPIFREIYSSAKFDSAGEIGNELFPVDIDKDGVYEFRQDVMAFDYMGPGGHASATFPPAIFQYNKKKAQYILATKEFPDFVLKELKHNIDGLGAWAKGNEKYGTKISQEEIDEITVRETFLYMVYAGKEEEAWKIFEEKYDFRFYQFRDKFREDFKEIFAQDPNYLSIYRRGKHNY